MTRSPTFTLDDATRCGLKLVRRGGWSSLSIAAVATELGVSPMALYRVVSDASDLRRAIADTAAAPLLPEPRDMPLVAELRAWAVAAYAHLSRLPGLGAFVLHEWTELPTWLGIVDTFLGMASETLDGPTAVATVNAVFAFVLARSQLREGVTTSRKLRPLVDYPDRFAHIRANAPDFRTAKTEAAFVFGLDALCAGLAVTTP